MSTPVVVLKGPALATEVAGLLAAAGVDVSFGTVADAATAGAVVVSCPGGSDPDLDATRREVAASGCPWLPVLPYGDAVLLPPVLTTSPCLTCLELRWLGLAREIAVERAFLRHLRSPPAGAHLDPVLLSSVLPHLLSALAEPQSDMARLVVLEDGACSQSRLLPHPRCPECTPSAVAGPAADVERAERPLHEVLAALRPVAGMPTGLAELVDRLGPRTAGPHHVAVARFALPDTEGVSRCTDAWVHGSAADPNDAAAIALVEAVERYCGLSVPQPAVVASYRGLQVPALSPLDLPLFSPAEYRQDDFPYRPFDADHPLAWVHADVLGEGRRVLVPLSAVSYGYDDELLGETSSGVAAHTSRAAALRNAVLELVERDAFMLHWLHRRSPPRVRPSNWGAEAERLLEAVGAAGYEVHIVDLTTDLRVPVVLALGVRDDGARPALLVGAGARLVLEEAVLSAAKELHAATLAATRLWRLTAPLPVAAVRRLEDHSRAYSHPSWLPHAAFLWSSDEAPHPAPAADSSNDPVEQLAVLRQLLRERGHSVLWCDLTTSDVQPLGFHVVRALVPGVQPLAVGPAVRRGGRRLYHAPVRMGWCSAPAAEEDLNPVPHCFP